MLPANNVHTSSDISESVALKELLLELRIPFGYSRMLPPPINSANGPNTMARIIIRGIPTSRKNQSPSFIFFITSFIHSEYYL